MPKIKIYDNLILENNWFWPTPTKVNSRCTFSKSLTSFVGFERTFKSRSHINKISGIICCSAINTEMGNKDFKKEVWIYLADLANINQSKSSQETFLFSTLVDKGIGSSTGRGGGLGTTKDLGQLGTWKTLGLGTSRRPLTKPLRPKLTGSPGEERNSSNSFTGNLLSKICNNSRTGKSISQIHTKHFLFQFCCCV